MSTVNLPGGKGRPARKFVNLTAICEPIVYKMWEPRRLTTLTSTACYVASFTHITPTFREVQFETYWFAQEQPFVQTVGTCQII
jgi:hypothetical protein